MAYVDILGFRDLVLNRREDAHNKLTKFYRSIYNLWEEKGYKTNKDINGHIFSDSFIIYTKDTGDSSLRNIFDFIQELYKKSVFKHKMLLRGALVKGEFQTRRSYQFSNLQKSFVIGQALVDAYRLESKNGAKGARFVFKEDIAKTINNSPNNQFNIGELITENNPQEYRIFELYWTDYQGLTAKDNENLKSFYQLANKNEWQYQYIHTLDFFCSIAGEDKYDIIKFVMKQIFKDEKENLGNHRENSKFNKFMKNLYSEKTNNNIEELLSGFIREIGSQNIGMPR